MARFLASLCVYVLPSGMGKNRLELFRSALDRHGARQIAEDAQTLPNDSHLVVLFDENTLKTYANVEKAIEKKKFYSEAKKNPSICRIHFVKSIWLSECLKQKRSIEFDSYEIHDERLKASGESDESKQTVVTKKRFNSESGDNSSGEEKKMKPQEQPKQENKRIKTTSYYDANSSSYSESDDNEDNTKINGFENDYLVGQLRLRSNALQHSKEWTCAHSSKEQESSNPNAHVIKKLEEMSGIYESTRDRYRALSYQKAIMAIKRLTKPIQNREVVIRIRNKKHE